MMIETERLRLREYADKDIPDLVKLANVWDIAKWLVALPYPYTHQCAVDWVATVHAQHIAGMPVSFAFALKDTDQIIGGGGLDGSFAGIGAKTGDCIALGYWLGLPYHGQGYATEITHALIAYGFKNLNADAIYASANPGNSASQRVLTKAGMLSMGRMAITESTREGGHMFTEAYHITRAMFEAL